LFSLTRSISKRKAGFARGTRLTRRCPRSAAWPAAVFNQQTTQVYLNGDVFEDGGVAISVGGDVQLTGVISQGCTPIGETWTAHPRGKKFNPSHRQPAGLRGAGRDLSKTPADEQRQAQGNLLIGLVVNEYLEDFHRGDFLVRNLIGGDPHSGVLAVGTLPRAGQTMQFQRRDAAAATEDMIELLARAKKQIGGATIYGGCLCCCNGRGKHLFGQREPRCRAGAGTARPARTFGLFLQRRNRAGRREEFSPRLHRVARAVCEKTTLARPEYTGRE
jgi:hypothetical protein